MGRPEGPTAAGAWSPEWSAEAVVAVVAVVAVLCLRGCLRVLSGVQFYAG